MTIAEAVDSAARSEGWVLWLVLVGGLVVLLMILGAVRRRLIRPMRHTPTDTTDSWVEAGRRLQTPPKDEKPPRDEDAR